MNTKKNRGGLDAQHGPRLAGEILHNYLENSNEPLAVAYREHHDEADGWHKNTELGVNLKTILRSDSRMKAGKGYLGVLRRDVEIDDFLYDEHFTFREERLTPAISKRNPHIFNGEFITATRRDDGSYRLNFKPLKDDADFSLERYALGVYNEICMALGGLIEEG